MRFSQNFLDEIRDRVPISSVIGPRVTWDKRKTNTSRGDWWACCPFHGENTPSFHCEDQKGRYHCFGCGVSGDHFRFLTELDGLSFPESVERIADMAGVPMPARDREAEAREEKRATLYDVMELATGFFEEKLQGAEGAKARAYLRERSLTSATQARFRMGYAPDSRNALKEFLAGKGVEKEKIEACGLVVFGPDIAVSYDRFRDRIMFPIANPRGKVIAFGGRALSPDVPAKYLNSPETELFHKSNVLYNLGPAREAARKAGTVIAVEGYMDVIALAQAGFDNAVAPLGTALTERQVELLWRVGNEPVLCFDGDQAGMKAAWRAADLILPMIGPGRSTRFALLPDGQDPDDLVQHSGADAFAAIIKQALPLADLIWMRETASGVFDTPERRAELEKTLRNLVFQIKDESVRRHYQQNMRERIQSYFGSRSDRKPASGGERKYGDAHAKSRLAVSDSLARSALVKNAGGIMPVREAVIIVALVHHPALIDEYFDQIETFEARHPELQQLHGALLDAVAHDEASEPGAIIAVIERHGHLESWDRAVALVNRTRTWPVLADAALDDARDAFAQALHLHRAAGALHRELKAAEAALANEPTEENYNHLLDIQSQFRDAQATEALIEGFGASSGRAGRSM
ncbi:MAG: DNA primase [Rhizobiaceae bacterium]